MAPEEIRINDDVVIPASELDFAFVRSGGPGGQHVNTAATKVELRFDVDASPSLSDEHKQRIRGALGSRITADGVLVLTSSEHRSQTRNREAAVARFQTLLADALRPRRPRKRTRRPRSADQRRLEEKRRTSEKKELRKPPEV
jgi:ribosome-associated protein